MSEIKIHKSLSHENIVGFKHFFEDQHDIFILLELCENQSLQELIKARKNLHELEVQCLLRQMCAGIQYMHDHYYVHRDLKLSNIFLDSKMQIKIGDFGLASKIEIGGEPRNTLCGTPNYIAPEIL